MKTTLTLLVLVCISSNLVAQNPIVFSFGENDLNLVNVATPSQMVSTFESDIAKNETNCKVYVGTQGAGLAVYDGVDWTQLTTTNTNNAIANDYINTVLVSSKNTLWVGHGGATGLLRWRESGATNLYTKANTNSGLPHSEILALDEDPTTGQIWIGTENGLGMYDNGSWSSWQTPDIPANIIRDVHYNAVDDEVWIATASGAAFYNGTDWTRVNTTTGLPDNFLFCLTSDQNGDMWFGGGLLNPFVSMYDGTTFTNYGSGQGISSIPTRIDVDGNGTVWISSQSWIHFKTSAASSFSMKDSSDGITHLSCRSIMADNDNNIYVATDSGFTILNDAGIVFCIDFTSVDVACKGDTTGSITADPRFGIAPYLYTWNNGNTTDNLTGLTAGIYSVNITDTNTFAASGSVTITEPDSALMITDTGHVNSSEFEANDGKAWITAVGGTSPRTITWFGSSQTGDTIINIGPGIYVATVVDANGCTEISDSLFVTEPPFVPGIDDADIQFNIYPNPSSGEVYIKTDRKARVEIIGLDGRVIKTRQLYPGIMQALQLDQGIYLARIVSNSGMKVQKLVVH